MAWSRKQKADTLANVPIFRGLTQEDRQLCAQHVTATSRPAGSVLARQDQLGLEMMIITSGQATVTRDGRTIATLKEGDVLGEMSLIDGRPRSATVTADTDVELLALSHSDFVQLLDSVPGFARKVLVALTERLRAADNELGAL
jgi:CRP/FNR family transcriptional regulator, cyclic AMP receptor protein